MTKYILFTLSLGSMAFAIPQETNPVHRMYLQLRANGWSLFDIVDIMVESEEMREAIVAYPLDDCFNSASRAFHHENRNCDTKPLGQQMGCYVNARVQLNEANQACGIIYGAASMPRCNERVVPASILQSPQSPTMQREDRTSQR